MQITQQLRSLRGSDVERALQILADGRDTQFFESTAFDLLWRERRFPPKAVVGLALELMTGQVFGPADFIGGASSACFRALKRLGYLVVPKSSFVVNAESDLMTLTRIQTPLSPGGEGITTRDGSVIAVQVQFQEHPGAPQAYKDQRLPNNDVLLIGRGKPNQGDQKRTHGNRYLTEAIERSSDESFPVYEKVGDNAYHYLGEFIGSAFTYEELDPDKPGYKVYRFILEALGLRDLESVSESGATGIEEFAGDMAPGVPPERRQVVQAIIARNRKLAGKAKHDVGYRCERCQSPPDWVTSEGKPYVEVHHIIPLGQDGFDDLRNMIVLCADCHKRLHHGADRSALSLELRTIRGLLQLASEKVEGF